MAARSDPDPATGTFRAAQSEHLANTSMTSPRVVTSDALLRGESQLAILHERTIYFLRRTRFGKLILTK
jgi:hemin uptake protein HemP